MKPTRAQRRALTVMRDAKATTSTISIAYALWGSASAANQGKANAMLERMKGAGLVTGHMLGGWTVTTEGRTFIYQSGGEVAR